MECDAIMRMQNTQAAQEEVLQALGKKSTQMFKAVVPRKAYKYANARERSYGIIDDESV